MKKLQLLVLLLLTSTGLFALPIGNPSEASLYTNGAFATGAFYNPCDPSLCWIDYWSARLGFYGDYVSNRHLQVHTSQDGLQGGDAVQTTQIATNAGYLALNIWDLIDIFGTLGTSTLHIQANSSNWNDILGAGSLLTFKTYFSWSAGARLTLWQCGPFGLGAEGQFFQTNTKIGSYFESSSGEITYFVDDNEAVYRDWQAGIGAIWRFSFYDCAALIPYIGVKWGWAHLSMNHLSFTTTGAIGPLTLNNLEAQKLWGYAVGMTFTLGKMIGVTAEGRFGDEKALYINGQFRF